MASTEDQLRQALARVGRQLEELAWTVGRDQRREARLQRRWRVLEAAVGIAATVAARKIATRIYYVLTGEQPPPQQQAAEDAARRAEAEPARRHEHDAIADEPTERERAETLS